MRLIFLTQAIDADHPALAQTVDLVDALAARCDRVTVLCDRVGRHELPANVRLRAFGSSARALRGARFEQGLVAELRPGRPPVDAVMSHMIPLFLVLAAPVARLRGVPLLLWYTHWNADRSLRVATRLADRIFSVDARSFPLATPKLQPTGHAIDVARFAPDPGGSAGDDDAPLRLLALGRMTPWKGYRTLLTAFEQALDRGLDATLEIRGPALTEAEGAHRDELERTVAVSPLLRDRVRVEQPVARDVIPELLRAVDALVSPTEPDGAETLDKVVYEAAACGIPVLSSNAALDEFLGGLPLRLRFGRRDPDDLAEALLALDRAPRSVRADVGAELRRRVVEGHSVDAWADQVVDTVARLRGARASGRGRE